jgi:hypothetical protein
LEALKRLPAGDADAINNFLVKVIAELLARVAARLSNLRFKLLLDLIELKLNLFGRPAPLVNGNDALSKSSPTRPHREPHRWLRTHRRTA